MDNWHASINKANFVDYSSSVKSRQYSAVGRLSYVTRPYRNLDLWPSSCGSSSNVVFNYVIPGVFSTLPPNATFRAVTSVIRQSSANSSLACHQSTLFCRDERHRRGENNSISISSSIF